MTSQSAAQTPDFSNLEVAEALAEGWERRRPFIEAVGAPVRAWLVRELAPQPGATVLELAAGVGDTGFELARQIGPQGKLLSTDQAQGMVDAARRRARELGIENVEFSVIDAHHIALADDSVDGVVCRFGYMLMDDPAAALAATRRVLRPGGRLALAVWGAPPRNPFFTTLAQALVQRGHLPPPDPEGPGLFRMADPARIEAMLTGAGFARVRVEPIAVRFRFADVAEYLAIVHDTAGAIAIALRGLGDEQRAELAASLESALAPHATADGYDVPGEALAAAAS